MVVPQKVRGNLPLTNKTQDEPMWVRLLVRPLLQLLFSQVYLSPLVSLVLMVGATNHLTDSSEHFVSCILSAGNDKIRIARGFFSFIAKKGQSSPFVGLSLHNVSHCHMNSQITYSRSSKETAWCQLILFPLERQ